MPSRRALSPERDRVARLGSRHAEAGRAGRDAVRPSPARRRGRRDGRAREFRVRFVIGADGANNSCAARLASSAATSATTSAGSTWIPRISALGAACAPDDYVIRRAPMHSFVRRTLGIERSDFGYNERWLNLDSENKRDLGAACALTTIYCDPARASCTCLSARGAPVSSCVCCPARKRPIGNRRTPAGAGCMNAMAWGRTT